MTNNGLGIGIRLETWIGLEQLFIAYSYVAKDALRLVNLHS